MSYQIIKAAPILALAACGPLPADYPGDVVAFNGHFLTIEAPWDGTAAFEPTVAMQGNAEQTCGGPAIFVSAGSKDSGARTIYTPYGPSYVSGVDAWPMTLFRFRCIG